MSKIIKASVQEHEIREAFKPIREAMSALEAAAPELREESRNQQEHQAWHKAFRSLLAGIVDQLDDVLAGKVAEIGLGDPEEIESLMTADDAVLAEAGATACEMAVGVQSLASLCLSTKKPHGCLECELMIERIHDFIQGEEPNPTCVEEVDLATAKREDVEARAFRRENGPRELPTTQGIIDRLVEMGLVKMIGSNGEGEPLYRATAAS